MICPKCGAKLEEGTRVCPICGKSLVATSVGTVFKRRDLQEYDELSSDEYDDSDYQDDGSYEEEQYDDTYQDDEYDEVLTRKNSMMMDMRRKVVHMIMKIMKPIFQTNQMRSR